MNTIFDAEWTLAKGGRSVNIEPLVGKVRMEPSQFVPEVLQAITAVPDLVRACEEAHRRGAHGVGPHDTGSRPDICWLCEAIAKAKGAQS